MSRKYLLDTELSEVNGGVAKDSSLKEEYGKSRLDEASMKEEMNAAGLIREEFNTTKGFNKDNLAKANIADAQKGISRFFRPIRITRLITKEGK